MIAIEPLGERALRFAIPEDLDRGALVHALRALPGVSDASVSESHACVCFEREPPDLAPALERARSGGASPARVHVVRAIYDGPDLDEAAALAGLGREALIARHAEATYVVSFVGFLPGFAYLRGLDEALAGIPRRDAPRPRVPAGSIAIAGGFTSIYPWSSPGGWRLVARAEGFAPLEGDRVRLAIGDQVRFERVG